MRISVVGILLVTCAVSACNRGEKQQAVVPRPAQEIAWRHGDVDDGFNEAQESGKPVLLYWGAIWCPPCNQLKATLFKDPAFIAQTRNFIPVYLDGDSRGAQAWGDRFGISGYPTVIILTPDREEITRLSSGADGETLASLLQGAAIRTTSFDYLLQKAETNPVGLSAEDWGLLAEFDWQNDPKRFKDPAKASEILARFARTAPDSALRRRFALLALATGLKPDDAGKLTLTPAQQVTIEKILPEILADTAEIRANRQMLSYAAPDMIAALPDARQRKAIGTHLIAALDGIYNDDSLSMVERLATINADITLARVEAGKGKPLPAPVLDKVRRHVAWADRTARDAITRQSVISGASYWLAQAGDPAGAAALLKAELPRSKSPYYYMLDLALLAEEQNQKPAAIDWARRAAERAEGPATRVQWAIEYSNMVMRLDPADRAEVEHSANAVLSALRQSRGDYYQRTSSRVTAWGEALGKWAEANKGQDVLARLGERMKSACGRARRNPGFLPVGDQNGLNLITAPGSGQAHRRERP